MKNKLAKKSLEKKSKDIRNLIKGVVSGTIDVPNNAMIFLDSNALIEIFTKRRMELIRLIDQFNPRSIQTLANLTERKKQAVDRDLKILEHHELIRLEKKGRTVSPKIEKKFLIFGVGLYSFGNIKKKYASQHFKNHLKDKIKIENAITAQVYVDGVNVNQEINKWM